MTGPHDRAAAREDMRARVRCRGVRARARGGGRAAGAVLAGPCMVRHTAGRGAFLGGLWSVLASRNGRVGVSRVACVCGVWRVACVRCGMSVR